MESQNEVLLFNSPVNDLDYLQRATQVPALIICDVNMPKLNGFQFREKLLDELPSCLQVPFYFLSTSRSPVDIKSAEDLKADGYYEKSDSYEGLRDTLKTILVLSHVLL